jgi:hypothetical protein
LKDKDTEINVLKEMLKSSKTMIRYKENELDRIKKQVYTSDPDVKLPRIYASPGKGPVNLKSDNRYPLPTLRLKPIVFKTLSLEKENRSTPERVTITEDVKKCSFLYCIANDFQAIGGEGSFYNNSKNKILPRELDDNYTGPASLDANGKKKKPNNNIFDPNSDVNVNPADVVTLLSSF